MGHDLYRVTGFEKVAPYTLRVEFDDGRPKRSISGPF